MASTDRRPSYPNAAQVAAAVDSGVSGLVERVKAGDGVKPLFIASGGLSGQRFLDGNDRPLGSLLSSGSGDRRKAGIIVQEPGTGTKFAVNVSESDGTRRVTVNTEEMGTQQVAWNKLPAALRRRVAGSLGI